MGAVLPTPVDNDSLYPSITPEYILSLKIFTCLISCLSIIGAVVVIVSYTSWCKRKSESGCACRVRSAVRVVCCNAPNRIAQDEEAGEQHAINAPAKLVTVPMPLYHYFVICICISDILVSISHIWGVAQHLETKFIGAYVNQNSTTANITLRGGTDTACTAQAVVNVFGTFASFMWTLALAGFLFSSECFHWFTNMWCILNCCNSCCAIQEDKEDYNKDPHCCATRLWLVFLWPLLGWGVPFVLFIALASTDLLGFSEVFDIVWCSIRIHTDTKTPQDFRLIDTFGYELLTWISLCGILFFCSLFAILLCLRKAGRCIKPETNETASKDPKDAKDAYQVNGVHVRYLTLAFCLILLRLWNTISSGLILTHRAHYASRIIAGITFIAGMANSAQGLVNAILFVCFTETAGQFCCHCCLKYESCKKCLQCQCCQIQKEYSDLDVESEARMNRGNRSRPRSRSFNQFTTTAT